MGVFEAGVVGAKASADVAEPGGREEGVADGVGDRVAVAVSRQAHFVGPVEPTEPEWGVGVVRVDVDTDTGAQREAAARGIHPVRRTNEGFGTAKVPGAGDFEREGVTGDHTHVVTRVIEECGVIGAVFGGGRIGRVEGSARKTLRRLHGGEG